MKIITIGGATQDIFIHSDDTETVYFLSKQEKKSFVLLQEGSKIEVQNITYATGGGATNSATSFKRLGFTVAPLCKLGNDYAAQCIIQQLLAEDIDTKLICYTDTVGTGVSYIIPSITGERTILAFRGANAHIQEKELPYATLKDSNYLYITSLSGDSSHVLLPITSFAKKNNIPVANNPGISQLAAGANDLREALPNIDILILNSAEAQQFMVSLVQTDVSLKELVSKQRDTFKKRQAPQLLSDLITYQDICFNLVQFFAEVLSRGPRIVVVTNGAEGVYVATEDKIYFHPSLPIQLISTLGAGDAFGSCFVASIAMGMRIEQAMVNGIINSHSVISYPDAKKGLLTLQKLEEEARKVGLGLVQTFSLNR